MRKHFGIIGIAVVMGCLSTGCATNFREQHYYQSINSKTGDVTNYYRLTVDGYGAFSSARYISGYYDERAVDLFFNELKVKQTPDDATDFGKFAKEDSKDPGTDEVIRPLSPDKQHGVFVMILSTNASSVSRTIGQFAENQVVADAITNLANRDVLTRAASTATTEASRANSAADEVIRVLDLALSSNASDALKVQQTFVRALNGIATGIASRPVSFADFAEASQWFAQMESREVMP